jgi:hypothetical protein
VLDWIDVARRERTCGGACGAGAGRARVVKKGRELLIEREW